MALTLKHAAELSAVQENHREAFNAWTMSAYNQGRAKERGVILAVATGLIVVRSGIKLTAKYVRKKTKRNSEERGS